MQGLRMRYLRILLTLCVAACAGPLAMPAPDNTIDPSFGPLEKGHVVVVVPPLSPHAEFQDGRELVEDILRRQLLASQDCNSGS